MVKLITKEDFVHRIELTWWLAVGNLFGTLVDGHGHSLWWREWCWNDVFMKSRINCIANIGTSIKIVKK